ncbi:MAG: hypothetical protein B0D92_03550 [Spirochaeta sp. LUC14_002_19_P3]|nr:MAG: hypothetical protein B0D92_03550 [Spirochaeta sp. LUC14_002_19_P3]
MREIYYGDNLEVLRKFLKDETVDLCYIDPPFNSKRNYNLIYNSIGEGVDKAQAGAFIDTWTWNGRTQAEFYEIINNETGRYTGQTITLIDSFEKILGHSSLFSYLVSMSTRLNEIWRVLKPTGSFYLHCDSTASHYLKLVLDSIFVSRGGDFQNEIVWCYQSRHFSKKHFGRKHDIIFRYTKSENNYTFNWEDVVRPLSENTIKKYKHVDEKGHYRLQGRGIKGSPIQSAKDVDPQWEITNPELVVRDYLEDKKGVPIEDYWNIDIINQVSKERLGYPTQKPEALLERIIKASSNEGDVVADFFCGCGTTVAVSEKLNRQYIGIDITFQSISLILKRLEDSYGKEIVASVKLNGIPKDVEGAKALSLKQDDRLRKEFEKWLVLTFTNNRGQVNYSKGADRGIDGRAFFLKGREHNKDVTGKAIIQVKSGHVKRFDIAALNHDRQRENADIAYFLTLEEPTKPMMEEAREAGVFHCQIMGRDYPAIQIITVKEILEQNKTMELPFHTHEVVQSAERVIKNNQGKLF